MKRHFLSLAALVVVAGVAMAGPPNGGAPFKVPTTLGNHYHGHHHHHGASFQSFPSPYHQKFVNYHTQFGTKYHFGYAYKGFHHNHWSRTYFSPIFGCKIYHCPSTNCAYYWCKWDACYYPVTYCKYGRYNF